MQEQAIKSVCIFSEILQLHRHKNMTIRNQDINYYYLAKDHLLVV